MGRSVYLGVSHAAHPKRVEFQRSPILGVLMYLCLHPVTQNDQIRHGSTYGEGRVLGQPRHCVCTNASCGLSATVWFLVQKSCARGDTVCLRPMQFDNIFAFIRQVAVLFLHNNIFVFVRQVAPVPACWLFKTSATS